MLRLFQLPLLALGFALASMAWEGEASAQSKSNKARPAKATKAAPAKPKKAAKPEAEAEKAKEGSAAPSDAKPAAEAEPKLRAAGTSQTEPTAGKASVKEKEGPEGVKTYQFGEIEVEGRQKSPQLIYFLRRVRAEFDAGALGHRSFLGELKDTRNDTAFR